MQTTSQRLSIRGAIAAAALAACSHSSQAQSNVTLYGIISQDVVRATNIVSGGRYRLDNGRLNASRLGFKGAEDLGGGLYGIFGIESGLNPDTGTANGGGTFWSRGAYVGLKSTGGGTLSLGRHWNVNDDLLGNFFIFGGYAVFSYGGFGATSDLYNNSAKYVSPSFGGFVFEALGALGEGTGPRVVEVAGAYTGGPFKAALTYHEADNRAGLRDKLTAAGVSYGMAGLNGRLGYARVDNRLSGTGTIGRPKAIAYDVGVDYDYNGTVGASLDYVRRDLKDSSADSHFIRLLGKYAFSKRTQLNANVVYLKNNAGAAENFYTLNGTGRNQKVFGVGLSHFF